MSRSPLPCAERASPSARRLRSAAFSVALLALPLGLGACTAHGELVADYPVVEVQTVPVQVETYPRVYYAGSYAYLVDGRWYYRSRDRWVVFRREPRDLARYRVEYYRRNPTPVYTAPPAHRRRNRP